ncbi:DUF711 family protein [Bergeriella denitrificans]|uniref:Uncharacterized conserved protein n=1 Tax=Bergeriella denitrificans TaxID=494 RepID=A0A378UIF4_BERDE|nr:DUF711 family protein [Bergeriella denitrificans]STZ77116.1 Uncharacterized conserved protein [Bergeriella denitrificans]
MQNLTDPALCRVRTVTAFVSLDKDAGRWADKLAEAKQQCDHIAAALQQRGYTVQSVRMVANPFGEYLDTADIAAASQGLAQIRDILNRLNANGLRIRFAIGEARTPQEIALLPELIRDFGDLSNACVNIDADEHGVLDNGQILRCVEAVRRIGEITPRGEGNFNFTVNFNCNELIPYFPAGYHRGGSDKKLVVGLESPDLLAAALRGLNNLPEAHEDFRRAAFDAMSGALQYHADQVQACIAEVPLAAGWTYAGMDTSAAPSKNCTSMVEVYRLLRVPHFGAAGTLEASALLTRVFKTLKNVRAVGFSGLMLAVVEDEGLAAATYADSYDLQHLIAYSSVCGIGLDTVPIEGGTPSEKTAAIMRDTGTMAFRLNKPLTVRLFPVPGLKAGMSTAFESDDLCNCAVLAVK